MSYVWYAINSVVNFAESMNQQEWWYALVAVVCFGAFCMRGFGKRI